MKAPRKPLTFDLGTSPVTDEEIEQASASSPQPKTPAMPRQQLGARIPFDLYKRLRIKAAMEGVLIQDLVERAVRELLERESS
jgi:hypothetical protein